MFEANGKDVARAKDREIAQEALKNGFTVNLRGLPYRYSPVLVIRIFMILIRILSEKNGDPES